MFAMKGQGNVAKVAQTNGEEDGDPNGIVDVDDGPDEDEESPYRDPPEGCVRLRPSRFHGIPSTVFVEYPPELGIRRNDVSVIEPLGARKLGYKSYWERICIKNAHCRAGFVKSEKYWTSLWSKHQNAEQMRELNCLQKINHFPASWCIGRKDRLTRTLNTMKRVHGAQGNVFDFHPETFILPAERDALHRLLKTEMSIAASASSTGHNRSRSFNSTSTAMSLAGGMWIVKPCASSCGQGIKVMTGQQAAALPKRKKAIVQRYLAKPYLIDGRKFDLRIYVLVSGVDPLRVYIHDEGLTRISTAKYTTKNLTNSFAHLTNYSINKNAPNFKAAEFYTTGSTNNAATISNGGGDEGDGEEGPEGTNLPPQNGSNEPVDPEMEGFKWSLAAFRRWLTKKEGRAVMEATFDRIFDLCLKTMIAAESEITPHLHSAAQYRSNCFELFGCDVILDSDLRPHLLEVNVSPSLMGSSPLDKKIKGMVIADILHIVGMYPHDPMLLKRYDSNGGGGGGSSGKGDSGSGANPFAFSSLSVMMNAQDRYRRDPCPETIEIASLGDTDASWLLLLMAEDELQRARSSKFHCVHPTPSNASYYTGLYRSGRFSDHLLAHWVMHGGSAGRYGKLIPAKYRPHTTNIAASATTMGAAAPVPVDGGERKVRAKSAGRSRASRTSTYVPAAVLAESTSLKVPRVSQLAAAGAAGADGPVRSVSLSPRPTARTQVVASTASQGQDLPSQHVSLQQRERKADATAVDTTGHRVRGHSEPRALQSAPSANASATAGLGSPPPSATAAPTSAVRARLTQGISQAAYYGSAIDPDTPSPPQRRQLSVQVPDSGGGGDYADGAGLESAPLESPAAAFRVQHLVASPHSALAPFMLPAGAGADYSAALSTAELTRRMQERAVITPLPASGRPPPRTNTGRRPSGSGTNFLKVDTLPYSGYVMDANPQNVVSGSSGGGSSRPGSAVGRPLTPSNRSPSNKKMFAVSNGLAVTGSGESRQLLGDAQNGRQSLSPIKRTSSTTSMLSAHTTASGGSGSGGVISAVDAAAEAIAAAMLAAGQGSRSQGQQEYHSQRTSAAARSVAPMTNFGAFAQGASPLKQRKIVGTAAAGASGQVLMAQVQRTLQMPMK